MSTKLKKLDVNDELGMILSSSTTREEKVHVRIQQRSGKKCITTIEGLATDLDVKKICKAFKRNFNCNGAIRTITNSDDDHRDDEHDDHYDNEEDENNENEKGRGRGRDRKQVIQLSGDQRTKVMDFLVDQEICHSTSIVLHGF